MTRCSRRTHSDSSIAHRDDAMLKRKVAEIFDTMAYGPAPEDSSLADAWLDSHDRTMGLFINNKFEKPEGRKMLDAVSPATGKVMCKTVEGTNEDVDKAIGAARRPSTAGARPRVTSAPVTSMPSRVASRSTTASSRSSSRWTMARRSARRATPTWRW